jgi:hypothetical protein
VSGNALPAARWRKIIDLCVRVAAGAIPAGFALYLLWIAVSNTLLHRHPKGEFAHAHEWDVSSITFIVWLGLYCAMVAAGYWLRWPRRREFYLLTSTPFLAVAVGWCLLTAMEALNSPP